MYKQKSYKQKKYQRKSPEKNISAPSLHKTIFKLFNHYYIYINHFNSRKSALYIRKTMVTGKKMPCLILLKGK